MHTSLLPNPFTPSGHLTLDLIYYSGVLLKDSRVPLISACTFGNPNPTSCTFRARNPSTSLLPNPLTPSGRLTLALIYYSGVLLKDPRVSLIPSCTFGNPNPSSCTFRARNPTSRLFSDAFQTIASLSKGGQCLLLV